MALDDHFAAEIQKVEASFGFWQFQCDPNEISTSIGIEPDEILRKGEIRLAAQTWRVTTPFNSWSIQSRSVSKDANEHLRELFVRLKGVESLLRPEWGVPSFSILYKATHLRRGNGPFFEADVIASVARFQAELWQDIYALDEEP